MEVWSFTGTWSPTWDCTLKEKLLFLSQKLSVVTTPLCARSSFQASISLAWTCTDLMCAFSTSMYSCVQLSYSVWKTYFLVLIYHPWHVQFFCLFSHNDSWAFGRWCDMHVPFMNKNSTVSCSLYFYKLWVSVIITMYYKIEASLALLSIFGGAVQETPKTACCCYPLLSTLKEKNKFPLLKILCHFRFQAHSPDHELTWKPSPWSSFHGIKRLHAREEATQNPTQLWHIWTL